VRAEKAKGNNSFRFYRFAREGEEKKITPLGSIASLGGIKNNSSWFYRFARRC
jgi:hypothetical protein